MMLQRFCRAASSYDQFDHIQELSAQLISSVHLDHHPRRILDIGCGTGCLTQLMATKYPQSAIDAVDVSALMIAKLNARHLKNVYSTCISYDHFIPTYQYDLIVSNAALHWMNISQSLVNVSSQLAKKGVAILTIYGQETSSELRQLLPSINRSTWVTSDGFLSGDQIISCGQSVFKSWSVTRHKQTQCFDSVLDLLTTQKQSGVNAKQHSEGLWTPRQLKKLEEGFMTQYGRVQLSYDIFLCIGTQCQHLI